MHCSKCRQENLTEKDFYLSTENKRGRHYYCISCHRALMREKYRQQKDNERAAKIVAEKEKEAARVEQERQQQYIVQYPIHRVVSASRGPLEIYPLRKAA
jgi:hypothetical protein